LASNFDAVEHLLQTLDQAGIVPGDEGRDQFGHSFDCLDAGKSGPE